MRQRLTAISIRQLPHPTTGSVKYWDTALPGFGVRVSARSKSYFLMYGKDRRLTTIGKFPAMSLQDARNEAKRLQVEGQTDKRLQRLSDAREAYLEECEAKNRPATVYNYSMYLNELNHELLTDIKRSDVDPGDAHRVTAWKVFMNWCVRNELIDGNPFAHLTASYASRSRVLAIDELRAIWHYDFPPYSTILKLCILTGQRRGQWSEYISEDHTLTFPAAVMKSGHEHTIPLTDWTASLLPVPVFNGWSKAKARLDKHVQVPQWTVHDLRRTFSTTMASLQVPLHVTEAILAHRTGQVSGVAATYNRYNYLIEMRAALSVYEEHVRGIVDVG